MVLVFVTEFPNQLHTHFIINSDKPNYSNVSLITVSYWPPSWVGFNGSSQRRTQQSFLLFLLFLLDIDNLLNWGKRQLFWNLRFAKTSQVEGSIRGERMCHHIHFHLTLEPSRLIYGIMELGLSRPRRSIKPLNGIHIWTLNSELTKPSVTSLSGAAVVDLLEIPQTHRTSRKIIEQLPVFRHSAHFFPRNRLLFDLSLVDRHTAAVPTHINGPHTRNGSCGASHFSICGSAF